MLSPCSRESPHDLASSAVDHPEVSSPFYWTSQSMDGGDTLAGARVANALMRRLEDQKTGDIKEMRT